VSKVRHTCKHDKPKRIIITRRKLDTNIPMELRDMLIRSRTLHSANINGKKANSYSINFANIVTQASAWLRLTIVFTVTAKEY
jgi:hypothetical protein